MAIKSLVGLDIDGNIDLNSNQIKEVRIDNLAADPTGSAGRIYYNTGTNVLKFYNGSAWVALSTSVDTNTTYDLSGVGAANGTAGVKLTGSDFSEDDVLIVGAGTTTVTRSSNTLTVTSNDEFDGTVTSVAQTHAGNAFSVGGSPITGAGTLAIGMAGTAAQYIDGAGDLTTFPTIPQGTMSSWELDADTGSVKTITDGETVLIEGSTYISTNVSAPNKVTITVDASEASTPSKLIARDASGFGYVDTPSSGDNSEKIATTAFVQASLTGLLEFKGGFNASTGAIVGGGNLTSGATRVAVAVGDYYVVTADGDFFGNAATPLTTGDSVIVQTAAIAGASVEADFIVVQSDTDLATLATVGLGNVNASTLDAELGIEVSYAAGTAKVGLDIDGLTKDLLVEAASDYFLPIYDGGSGINNKTRLSELLAFGNQSTSKAGTITAGSLSGTVTHTFGINTLVQTINSSGDTVYCDVTRTATTSVATIAVAEATDITILVQKIG